jgi:hypothetical protein
MHRRLLASAAVFAFLRAAAFAQSPAAQTTTPLLPSPLSTIPQTADPRAPDPQAPDSRAGAPAPTAPQAIAPPPIEWEDIVGADGRYRLQMPNDYHYLEAQRQPGAPLFREYSIAYPGRFGFQLMVSDRSGPAEAAADVATRLADMQDDLQRSWPSATVLEQKPIQLGTVPGRAFTLSIDHGQSVVMVRLYYTAQALYTQVCEAPAAHRRDPAVTRFFDSFSLAQV